MALGAALTAAASGSAKDKPPEAMDPAETAVLEEVNLARTHPAEYATYVEEHKRNFKGPIAVVVDGRKITRTVEGFRAVDEAIAFLQSVKPVPALSASGPLTRAARDHVMDTGPSGITGHIGTDGSHPWERLARYGRPGTVSGEVINYGAITPRSIIVQLIVDDGVPDRAHRKTLFEPDFRVAGVAMGPHKTFELMCVIDFADRMRAK